MLAEAVAVAVVRVLGLRKILAFPVSLAGPEVPAGLEVPAGPAGLAKIQVAQAKAGQAVQAAQAVQVLGTVQAVQVLVPEFHQYPCQRQDSCYRCGDSLPSPLWRDWICRDSRNGSCPPLCME